MDKKELKSVLHPFYTRGFKFIAKDKDDGVHIYKSKPTKEKECWVTNGVVCRLISSDEKSFNIFFGDIKFDDKEPFDIVKAMNTIE